MIVSCESLNIKLNSFLNFNITGLGTLYTIPYSIPSIDNPSLICIKQLIPILN